MAKVALVGERRALTGAYPARLTAAVGSLAAMLLLSACTALPGLASPAQPTARARSVLAAGPDRFAKAFSGQCEQREADGYRERASLRVVERRVETLAWNASVGERGSCAFDAREFRQTRSQPHLEMTARDGSGCRLLIYQDRRRVTLAHHQCEQRCSPGIADKVWPVMFDPSTGACAALQ